MRRAATVFVGGGGGACLRALVLAWLAGWDGLFPASVLLVNVVGSFVLGVVYVLADEAGLLRAPTRLFLAVGLLGGFTTFSTFGWGADALAGQGATGAAALYVGASMLGGVLALGLGLVAGRELIQALERAALAVLRRLDARREARGPDVGVRERSGQPGR